MERLKHIKECLVSQVESQMANLQSADTKELGEVIDMIKDMAETEYYCSITKAMEESKEEEKYRDKYQQRQYYGGHQGMGWPPIYYYPEQYRDMDREDGRMYYNGNSGGGSRGGSNSNGGGMSRGGNGRNYYTEQEAFPIELRDYREGRSPLSRRMYMESKQMHQGKEYQMRELEKYLQELAQDVAEMVQDASPEEKQMAQQKISALATKIK